MDKKLKIIAASLLGVAVLSTVLYAWTSGGYMYVFVGLSHFLLLAAAAFTVGGFFGYLFSIPSLPPENSQHGTMLTQTADLLTKILLGAGLVQMKEIFGWVSSSIVGVAEYAKEKNTISTLGDPTFFIGTLVVFFSVFGFISMYFLFASKENKEQKCLTS